MAGPALVWLAAVGFLLYCLPRPGCRDADQPAAHRRRRRRRLASLLAVLLGSALPPNRGIGRRSVRALRVRVAGEQWWWRVRYPLPGGGEVRGQRGLPRGARPRRADERPPSGCRRSQSRWSMIPGRTTFLDARTDGVPQVPGPCVPKYMRRLARADGVCGGGDASPRPLRPVRLDDRRRGPAGDGAPTAPAATRRRRRSPKAAAAACRTTPRAAGEWADAARNFTHIASRGPVAGRGDAVDRRPDDLRGGGLRRVR